MPAMAFGPWRSLRRAGKWPASPHDNSQLFVKTCSDSLLLDFRFRQLLLHVRRQFFNAFDVSSHGPQFLIGLKFAIGEHAGKTDTVLGYPENLRFRVGGAGARKLGNGRIQTVAGFLGFAGCAVASGASVEIHASASDEILVR